MDYLWDARAALGVAVACGAAFMREVLPGVYESDMGLWETDAAALLRERRAYDTDDLCVLMNVTPEFASPLGSRPRGACPLRGRLVAGRRDPGIRGDGGRRAGARGGARGRRGSRRARARPAQHRRATRATSRAFAPFIGGVVVGSDLKRDGDTWGPVERERVRRFLDAARSA